MFRRLLDHGQPSNAPLRESFFRWVNLRRVLIALFGLTAGQAVVWYTGQLYALYFLTQTLQVDASTASLLVAASLAIGAPFFIAFGSLSDRIGRKPIIMTGCLLAAVGYFPLFEALTEAANPALARATRDVPVVLHVDARQCSFQGSPLAREIDFRSACDIGRRALAQAGIEHTVAALARGGVAQVLIGTAAVAVPEVALAGGLRSTFDHADRLALVTFRSELATALRRAGYPERADPSRIDTVRVIGILSLLMLLVTMVYGPIAAMLVELFPTRIRYTSVSLPYHLGNGWFGGLLPALAFGMVAQSGSIYHGLWYPVAVAAATFVIGMLFVPETLGTDIDAV